MVHQHLLLVVQITVAAEVIGIIGCPIRLGALHDARAIILFLKLRHRQYPQRFRKLYTPPETVYSFISRTNRSTRIYP
jgi:hypothetical protein